MLERLELKKKDSTNRLDEMTADSIRDSHSSDSFPTLLNNLFFIIHISCIPIRGSGIVDVSPINVEYSRFDST